MEAVLSINWRISLKQTGGNLTVYQVHVEIADRNVEISG